MSTQTKAAPLYIHSLEIQNFLGIKYLQVDLNGRSLLVTGSNGVGKTSFMKVLKQLFGGTNTAETPEPIRHGERQSILKCDLGEYLVKESITVGKNDKLDVRLEVLNRDGSKAKTYDGRPVTPTEFMKAITKTNCIDPVEFKQSKPFEQTNALLKLAGAECPVAKVQELTGERFAAKAGESAWAYLERLVGEEGGVFYVRRTEIGRACEVKKGALADQQKQLIAAGGPPTGEAADQDTGQLVAELTELDGQAEAKRTAEKEAADAIEEVRKCRDKIAALASGHALVEKRIADLESQLAAQRQVLAMNEDQRGKAELILAECEQYAADAKITAHGAADPSLRLTEVRAALQSSEAKRKEIAKRRSLADQVERLRLESAQKDAEHERAEALVKALRHLQDHLLDGADLGFPGLSIADGEPRLDGKPLRQSPESVQDEVSLAVAMAQRPALRLIRVADGNHWDSAALDRVFARAKKGDGEPYQLITERVEDVKETRADGTVETRPMPLTLRFWEG
jgi:energy-coupling factor transporter ATP-binding protein EcfA2